MKYFDTTKLRRASNRQIIAAICVTGVLLLIIAYVIPEEKPPCPLYRYGSQGVFPKHCPPPIVLCNESSILGTTGLEDVQEIIPRKLKELGQVNSNSCKVPTQLNIALKSAEVSEVKRCVSSYETDWRTDHDLFWTGDNQYIRWKHHRYLKKYSIVFDIGGNVGDDAEELMKKAELYKYILLEPMEKLYIGLREKFKDREFVNIYNIGLAAKTDQIKVNIEGNFGDATSVFKSSTLEGTCTLRVVNATEFFIAVGVGCYEVDLLTINCEGCEYDVLESILSSSFVKSFKNIQFATHSKLAYLKDPVERYCVIQRILARTHSLTYQYKFNWESWRRKDLL